MRFPFSRGRDREGVWSPYHGRETSGGRDEGQGTPQTPSYPTPRSRKPDFSIYRRSGVPHHPRHSPTTSNIRPRHSQVGHGNEVRRDHPGPRSPSTDRTHDGCQGASFLSSLPKSRTVTPGNKEGVTRVRGVGCNFCHPGCHRCGLKEMPSPNPLGRPPK